MKSCISGFIVGGLTAVSIMLVMENKQQLKQCVKDISTKTEQMLKKFKGPKMTNNECEDDN